MTDTESYPRLKQLSVRVDALRRAMDSVMAGTTEDFAKWGVFKNYARIYDAYAREFCDITSLQVNLYKIDQLGSSTNTTWPVQKEIFDTIYADVLILSGLLAHYDVGRSASISDIQDLLAANLRKAIFGKPERELDIQNSIEALLVGRGYQKPINYDREAGAVKFSGRTFIPDFVFPNLSLAMEVKLIKDPSRVSSSIEEISADIPAYLSQYERVLFCIYDIGQIRDVFEYQSGIEKQEGIRILVIKH